ncbi:hypothetical protein [Streptomyces sp. NPDC059389]|uniref:hypothetical protein n=1 Tax=Streptomyces sp. NPDC059389 TaxID=3346818 RepID=UPI0036D1B245
MPSTVTVVRPSAPAETAESGTTSTGSPEEAAVTVSRTPCPESRASSAWSGVTVSAYPPGSCAVFSPAPEPAPAPEPPEPVPPPGAAPPAAGVGAVATEATVPVAVSPVASDSTCTFIPALTRSFWCAGSEARITGAPADSVSSPSETASPTAAFTASTRAGKPLTKTSSSAGTMGPAAARAASRRAVDLARSCWAKVSCCCASVVSVPPPALALARACLAVVTPRCAMSAASSAARSFSASPGSAGRGV